MKNKIINFWKWIELNRDKLENEPNKDILEKILDEMNHFFEPDNFLLGTTDDDKHDLVIISYKKTHRFICKAFEDLMPETLKDKWQVSRFNKANNCKIEVNDREFTIDDFEVYYKINEQQCVLDIEVYSPLFKGFPINTQNQVTFLILDAVFGELVVEERIGSVKTLTKQKGFFKKVPGIHPKDLNKVLLELCDAKDWHIPTDPTDSYFVFKNYNFGNKHRNDTITGITRCSNLLYDIYAETNELEAMQVYLYFAKVPCDVNKVNSVINFKENQLNDFLEENKLGYVIGHAIGEEHYYIDYMILDNDEYLKRSSDIVNMFNTVDLIKL